MRSARTRAKKKDIPFSLTRHWIEDRLRAGHCEATGIRFSFKSSYLNPFGPSLDRVDSSLGYTPDNVQVVVWAYNNAKGPWDSSVLTTIAEAIVESTKVDSRRSG